MYQAALVVVVVVGSSTISGTLCVNNNRLIAAFDSRMVCVSAYLVAVSENMLSNRSIGRASCPETASAGGDVG